MRHCSSFSTNKSFRSAKSQKRRRSSKDPAIQKGRSLEDRRYGIPYTAYVQRASDETDSDENTIRHCTQLATYVHEYKYRKEVVERSVVQYSKYSTARKRWDDNSPTVLCTKLTTYVLYQQYVQYTYSKGYIMKDK